MYLHPLLLTVAMEPVNVLKPKMNKIVKKSVLKANFYAQTKTVSKNLGSVIKLMIVAINLMKI